ncbi:hypothetical protein CHUAL_007461 [Chamberlinius hualienensis]
MKSLRLFQKLNRYWSAVSNRDNKYLSTYVVHEIIYRKNGDPNEVLEMVEKTISPSLMPNEVVIKILAAPIHPADMNGISGVYGTQPPLPAVPGLECAARVLEVGSNVKSFKTGDRALLSFRNWGTWRTHQICPEHELVKIPDKFSTLAAATLVTNPGTAIRMLSDYVQLKEGDTVIQNTANSAVGQAVIQIARHRGLRTINIIRNRPNVEQLKTYLTSLGADCVITDEDLRLPATKDLLNKFSSPLLALNGASGRILSDSLKYLADHATVVTYGGMARQPVTTPIGLLIFKDISFRGFWFNRWLKSQNDSTKIREMVDFLFSLVANNALRPPVCNLVPFQDYKTAVALAMEPFSGKKQVLVTENLE